MTEFFELLHSDEQAALEAAGLERVTVELTHEVADGMHGAIVRARKPYAAEPQRLPLATAGKASGCC